MYTLLAQNVTPEGYLRKKKGKVRSSRGVRYNSNFASPPLQDHVSLLNSVYWKTVVISYRFVDLINNQRRCRENDRVWHLRSYPCAQHSHYGTSVPVGTEGLSANTHSATTTRRVLQTNNQRVDVTERFSPGHFTSTFVVVDLSCQISLRMTQL
jgi:hypothetical protein